jgi:hypothetical protein
MVIPCCFYDFDGQKYNRHDPRLGHYRTYLQYIRRVGEACGYRVEEEALRIPSTKNIALFGRSRTFARGDTAAEAKVPPAFRTSAPLHPAQVAEAREALLSKFTHFVIRPERHAERTERQKRKREEREARATQQGSADRASEAPQQPPPPAPDAADR